VTAVTERPRLNRLVVSRPGKRIIVLFIVLGVLGFGGAVTVGIINGSRASHTAHQLDSYYADAAVAFQTFSQQSQACAGQLACLHDADSRFADSLEHFRSQLDTLTFPPQSIADAQQFRTDIANLVGFARQLQAASPAAYNSTLTQLQPLATRFDRDYATLRQGLPA
jgi:hypothetical protein